MKSVENSVHALDRSFHALDRSFHGLSMVKSEIGHTCCINMSSILDCFSSRICENNEYHDMSLGCAHLEPLLQHASLNRSHDSRLGFFSNRSSTQGVWHLFSHSIWHLFRHSIWHSVWHFFWFYLAFSPACVRIQAWPTASGARHMARIRSCSQSRWAGRREELKEEEEVEEKGESEKGEGDEGGGGGEGGAAPLLKSKRPSLGRWGITWHDSVRRRWRERERDIRRWRSIASYR